jgi:hypothetical protein
MSDRNGRFLREPAVFSYAQACAASSDDVDVAWTGLSETASNAP